MDGNVPRKSNMDTTVADKLEWTEKDGKYFMAAIFEKRRPKGALYQIPFYRYPQDHIDR